VPVTRPASPPASPPPCVAGNTRSWDGTAPACPTGPPRPSACSSAAWRRTSSDVAFGCEGAHPSWRRCRCTPRPRSPTRRRSRGVHRGGRGSSGGSDAAEGRRFARQLLCLDVSRGDVRAMNSDNHAGVDERPVEPPRSTALSRSRLHLRRTASATAGLMVDFTPRVPPPASSTPRRYDR
jgi:hypothetical protein